MRTATTAALIGALLATLAGAATARSNTNGVYLHIDPSFYDYYSSLQGGETTRRHHHSADEAAYACNGSGHFTPIPAGSDAVYCSRDADVRLTWKVVTESASGANQRTHYFEATATVDDADAGHCGSGEAVVWDASGEPTEHPPFAPNEVVTTMRSTCQHCAYAGGDCE